MTVPSQVAWASNNMGGHYKRGFCTAVQIGLGSTSAFVPLMTFIPSDAPAYTRAFRIRLSLTILAALVMVLTEVGLWRENRQRKAGKRNWRLRLLEDKVTNLDDDHPHFRLTYQLAEKFDRWNYATSSAHPLAGRGCKICCTGGT